MGVAHLHWTLLGPEGHSIAVTDMFLINLFFVI